MTEESAKSYDAIVNVSCSPCAYFHPAFPGQYMHWYPVNEMGEWSYGYFYWLVKVLDFHYEKGHKVYLHCLPVDTEVMTEHGWKKLSKVKNGEKVVAFDPALETYKMSEIKNHFIRDMYEGEKCYSLTSPRLNKSITSTEGHRNAFKPSLGVSTENLPNESLIKDWFWGGYGTGNGKEEVDTNLLLLVAWVVGDGSVYEKNKTHLSFHLKKQRKVERIVEIATSLGMKSSLVNSSEGSSYLYVTDPDRLVYGMVGENKEYPLDILFKISRDQAKALVEEMVKIDGDYENFIKKGAIRLNTKKKSDVDFLTALISMHYGVCTFNKVNKKSNFIEDHFMYYVNAIPLSRTEKCKSGFHNTAVKKQLSDYVGKVSCFEVDTGFFLARQDGITFVTGNCHAGAYRSPHAAIFWLMSRGHTHEEAVEIEYNNPERVKEYKEERGGQHWKYKLTYCYRMGNIPKNVAELFKRMRENPTWSLAGVLLHGKKWIELSPEVMGNKRSRFRHWMHTTFWFYYRPKWWLKRRIDYGMYYVRGFQIEQPADSFGWSITNRPGEFASICRKIHKWRLKSWLKAFVSRS